MRHALARGVSLSVLTQARTAAHHDEDLGCSILGPASRPVRRAHLPLKRLIRALGPVEAVAQAKALIRWLEATPAYAALGGGRRRGGRLVLREAVRFPDVRRTPPRVLHVRRDGVGLDVPVGRAEWPLVHELFSTLARGATRAELAALRRTRLTAEILEGLRSARWLEAREAGEGDAASAAHGTFVGHNTTLLRGRTASVLVDPYFRPASAIDLPSYQPMQPRDVGHVDAVLITHSHGDHFHLGSLLQLPRDVRVFVPPVERENLFSTDCAARLRQVGFTQVEALAWGASRQVGDVQVTALPFYGEQPTAHDGVQDLVNVGSTWLVETPHLRAAFFADTGRDVRGDMAQVAKRLAGRVDVLFCGIRGFKVKPIFYGFSTLDAYLVDVPLSAMDEPQQLMADASDALDYARAMGARALVPCADGGAPWYWREGMGPKYPGFPGAAVEGASQLEENPAADPFPERVVAQGRTRGQVVELLRPGSHFVWRGGRLEVTSSEPFRWLFEPPRLEETGVQRTRRGAP